MAYRFPPYWAEMHGLLIVPKDILEILDTIDGYNYHFIEQRLSEISLVETPPYLHHKPYTRKEFIQYMANRGDKLPDSLWFVVHGNSHCLKSFEVRIESKDKKAILVMDFSVVWDPLEFAMVPHGIRIKWELDSQSKPKRPTQRPTKHFDGYRIQSGVTHTTHLNNENFGKIISHKLDQLCTHTGMTGMAWRGYF